MSVRTIISGVKLIGRVLGTLIGLVALWWLSRDETDHVGEMVVDQDYIDWDDDLGEDVDVEE